MTTFLIAYAAVWLLVSLYVLRLGTRQRQLLRGLESLQAQLERTTHR
jgi:CcmD family protein